MMAWLLLAAAIAVEVVSSSALKLAASGGGAAGPIFTLVALGGVVTSYGLMAWALRLQMEISVAYAIWSGVGTAAIAIIGAAVFHESMNVPKLVALILIIAGVALLQTTARADATTAQSGSADEASTLALVTALRELGHALSALPEPAALPGSVASSSRGSYAAAPARPAATRPSSWPWPVPQSFPDDCVL